MFLLTHFCLIVVSTMVSFIVLGFAGADKGQASFYLMLLTPTFTIIHHIIILFLPTYRPSHLAFDASPNGAAFPKPSTPPTHTGAVYLAFLILISALWTGSVLTTLFLAGLNVGREVEGMSRQTGPIECAFGAVETGISWVIFVKCMNQRIFRCDGIPSP